MSANSGALRGLFPTPPAPPLRRVRFVMNRHPSLRCALALAAASLPALAAGTAAPIAPQAVSAALVLAQDAARALAPPGARVVAEAGALDPRLQLAPCAKVDSYLPSGTPVWGRTRVGLRCAQGAVAWTVFLPVNVQVWAAAPVAALPLPAGARIDASQLATAEVDWAASPAPPTADRLALQGRVLVRPVAAGMAIRASDLQPRQWFAAGATVTTVARGNGFAVSAAAQALTPGTEGLPVRVRFDSGRIVVARPVADHRVEVDL